LGKPRRFGDDEKQIVVQGYDVVLRLPLDRSVNIGQDGRRRTEICVPAGVANPLTAPIGDDAELGAELTSIFIDHGIDRWPIGCEPDVRHVRAKDWQRRNETYLRGRKRRAIGGELIKRFTSRFKVFRRPLQRPAADGQRRNDQDGDERRGNEETKARYDARFQTTMPRSGTTG
jgi:hypothetical protein